MARPKTRCALCGKSNKSPHGLYLHDLRVHKRHNWGPQGFYKKSHSRASSPKTS